MGDFLAETRGCHEIQQWGPLPGSAPSALSPACSSIQGSSVPLGADLGSFSLLPHWPHSILLSKTSQPEWRNGKDWLSHYVLSATPCPLWTCEQRVLFLLPADVAVHRPVPEPLPETRLQSGKDHHN